MGSEQGSNAYESREGKKIMKIDDVIWLYRFLRSLYMAFAFKDKYFLLQKNYVNKELLIFSSSSTVTMPLFMSTYGLTHYLIHENTTIKTTICQSAAVGLTEKIISTFPVAVVVCSSLNVVFIVEGV